MGVSPPRRALGSGLLCPGLLLSAWPTRPCPTGRAAGGTAPTTLRGGAVPFKHGEAQQADTHRGRSGGQHHWEAVYQRICNVDREVA